jgi:hypothetical protein
MDTEPRNRVRRTPPERTGPLRNMAAMFRAEPSMGPASASPAGAPGGSVEHAVDTAYRVLEEHLQRGRQAASQRPRAPLPGLPEAPANLQGVARGALHLWGGLLSTWVEVARPLVPPALRSAWRGPPGSAEAAAPSPAARPLSVELSSSRPVEVELDLPASADPSRLSVEPLRALDGAAAPLAVSLLQAAGGARARLRLEVPSTQPPGTYFTLIRDMQQGETRGSLLVRVLS